MGGCKMGDLRLPNISLKDSGWLMFADWNSEGLRAGFLAGFVDKRF
jgi:hypothetical protein